MKSSINLQLLLCGLALAGWCGASAQQSSPAATPAPPPSAPAKLSAAELEKLVAPIALYPDPLLATILPASVYPLEIVQAARFVADTNNLAKLDAQPWDDSVKAVARIPAAIQKLNADISWTIALGEAFLAQDKDIMDAIQAMRAKAQKAGTLQTTPQQIVTVTNMIIEKTVEQQVVVVTNTVVQIAPASSSVVYVPAYNPYTVYYPPPAYVYNPLAPLVTFGAAVAVGAIIANNCNWYGGGCYHGDVNINVNNNNNFNQNNNINRNNNANRNNQGGQQKWQPDQNRLSKSGSASATTRSAEARGYGSGGAKPSTGSVGARPSTGTATARPSTGAAAARPSTGTGTARPSTGGAGAAQTSTWGGSANRSTPSPSTSQSRSAASSGRPSSAGSAFGGSSGGASANAYSNRGSSSRSSSGGGFSGGGSRGGGGASRGGGGGGGRR